jgi:Cu-Zn family superoxide dismutase
MKTRTELHMTGLCTMLILAACGCEPPPPGEGANPDSKPPAASSQTMIRAVALLNPTQGNQAKGTVTFTPEGNGVRVVADVTGLKEGMHGFHVHEKGDCSASDGTSAGGHFNPLGVAHGGPGADQHHIGDLGNISADASGNAHLDKVFSFLSLSGTNSIVGRGLIVHAGKDDLTSQPTGDAGGRVACGVIQMQK